MDCVFCKIVAREVPAEIVYEDEHFLAFLDIHPRSPGHTQVIPKQHFRFVWDVPDVGEPAPNIGGYFSAVRRVARALQGTFGTEFVFSKVMGDEVPHAHIWLFPHPGSADGDVSALRENARKVREQL